MKLFLASSMVYALIIAVIIAVIVLVNSYGFLSLDKNRFNKSLPDAMSICLEESSEVRCIGEKTKYGDQEVMFYRCEDDYTAVTSLFTHVCEARRRSFLNQQD